MTSTSIAPRPLTEAEWHAAYRELQQVIKPFIAAKVGIYNTVVHPPYVLHDDGRLEPVHVGLSEELREVLVRLDDMQREASCHLVALLERGVSP